MKLFFRLLLRAYNTIRGRLATRHVSRLGSAGRIRLSNRKVSLIIDRQPTAEFVLNGTLTVLPFRGSVSPAHISLGNGSTLTIDGDFEIGAGTCIIAADGASIHIGGRRDESASGITGCTRVMAYRSIHIGYDFICAWGVFITDCDWHQIGNRSPFLPTLIGDHVWVAPNSMLLKGTRIGDGCIVGAGSVVQKFNLPTSCLGGGNPFKILRRDVEWSRDIAAQFRPDYSPE